MVKVGGKFNLQGQEAGGGLFALFRNGADKDAAGKNVGVATGEYRVAFVDIEVFGNIFQIDRRRVTVPP